MISNFYMIIINMIMALISMAFFTLLERKLLGYLQSRKGPNKVSLMGILQPFADAIKLFSKENTSPSSSNTLLFILSPSLSLLMILLMWMMYPYLFMSNFFMFGLLIFLCLSSLNVYTTFASGWSSNSKYALLGAIRSVAQTISYEVSMAMVLLSPLMIMQTFDFNIMMYKTSIPMIMFMPSITILWFITSLAETNRSPFDFVEGESELVSGYNVSYSGGGFAMLFMAEYASILFMSMLSILIFLTSNKLFMINILLIPFLTLLTSILFIWTRGALPRMRYDQLMIFAWKIILPFTILHLINMFSLMIMI